MVMFGSSEVQTTGSSNCHANHYCADERSIWILWAAAILGHLWAYTTHEFAGKHHKNYPIRSYFSSQQTQRDASKYELEVMNSVKRFHMDSPIYGVDSNDDLEVEIEEHKEAHNTVSATIQKFTMVKPVQPEGTLAMVSWPSNMLVSFKIFLGRFDARKMQVALLDGKRGLSGVFLISVIADTSATAMAQARMGFGLTGFLIAEMGSTRRTRCPGFLRSQL
jgi:hypothetical protein